MAALLKGKKGNTLRLLSLTLQFEKQEIVFRQPQIYSDEGDQRLNEHLNAAYLSWWPGHRLPDKPYVMGRC